MPIRSDSWSLTEFAVNGQDGTIAGTAAVYNRRVDRGFGFFVKILPGAFAAQLADPARVKVLWQHQRDVPIGHATALDDSRTRLDFAARITDATQQARDALALLRDKVVDEVSVGFDFVTWDEVTTRAADGSMETTFEVSKAKLSELSVVTFGALGRSARVKEVHHLTAAGDLRVLAARRARAQLARRTMS